MIGHAEVLARAAAGGDRIPLLTLAEFFAGNDAEDSIAPNQWGFGRPPLAEIRRRLESLAADPAVVWTRVQPHEEMFEDGYDQVVAEGVAICTTLTCAAVDARLDTDGLQASGVYEGFAYDAADLCDIPPVPEHARVLTLSWD